MSVGITLVLIAVGAAAIAVWINIRFPAWAPSDLTRMVMHTAAVTLATRLALPTAFHAAGDSNAQKAVVLFLVAFPSVVYAFLVGFWMIKLAQRSFSGLR